MFLNHPFRWLKKIKYPKLLLLLFSILFAYFFFQLASVKEFINAFKGGGGYFLIFISGLFFSYGFTAPLAVGFFISLAPQVNIFIAAPLAGFAAAISDFLIFHFIRFYFVDEFRELSLSFIFQEARQVFNRYSGPFLKKYFLWGLGGLILASPLPDEFGVSLLSGFTNINQKIFFIASFCFDTIGIFVILRLAI